MTDTKFLCKKCGHWKTSKVPKVIESKICAKCAKEPPENQSKLFDIPKKYEAIKDY